MNGKITNNAAGFTLVELMVSMAISAIVLASMYSVFQAQVRGQVSQDVSLSMTQSLRAAMEIMASDIRMAGCDPLSAGTGFVVASPSELRITMDSGGGPNGAPNGKIESNEDIRYAINSSGNLGREVGAGGGLQPIARNCEALNFVYLDASGNPFVPKSTTDLKDISAVEISIVIASAANESENPGFLKKYTDNTTYTNLRGDVLLNPPGDAVRRFQLNETIDCRNI